MIPDNFYEVNFPNIELPKRQCQFCHIWFIPETEEDYTCETCAKRFDVKCTKRDFITTNWEEKRMKKQWQKRYDKANSSILSHCNGCKYENPKTK